MHSLRLDLPFDKALEELTARLAHENVQAEDSALAAFSSFNVFAFDIAPVLPVVFGRKTCDHRHAVRFARNLPVRNACLVATPAHACSCIVIGMVFSKCNCA